MILQLYFWIGVVLCTFSIIVLIYLVMRARRNINKTLNHKNLTANRFIMLASSDTLSIFITSVLLLTLGTTINNPEDRKTTHCSTDQLVMRLSVFLIPVLTGLTSIPAWMFHSYKCTDCTDTDMIDDKYKNRQETGSTKQWFFNTTMAMIVLQWLIPSLSVLPITMTEPEITKMHLHEPLYYNTTEFSHTMMMNMGVIICEDLENETATDLQTLRTDKQVPVQDETINTISTIVNEIYTIVEQYNGNNSNKHTQIQLQPLTEDNTYVKFFNQLMNKNNSVKTNNKIPLDNHTIQILNNIAVTMQNADHFNKLFTKSSDTSDSNKTSILNNNTANINILKLMANITQQNNKNDHRFTPTNTYQPTNEKITTQNMSIYRNQNISDYKECFMACQPSKELLKRVFFILMFTNLFFPLTLSAVLKVLTNKSLQMQQDDTVSFKRYMNKLTGRNALIGLVTLPPTLLETITRTILSLRTPELISSVLLAIALIGMVMRNLTGLQIVNNIQNSMGTVHPLQEATNDGANNETTQEVIVHEIQPTA